MMLRVALVLAVFSTPAAAMVACPATQDGHPLARSDGASLYLGNPTSRMLLAPTRQARTMKESNVWVLDGQSVTLVCQYEGTRKALAAVLPTGTRSCTQDLARNTMACQ